MPNLSQCIFIPKVGYRAWLILIKSSHTLIVNLALVVQGLNVAFSIVFLEKRGGGHLTKSFLMKHQFCSTRGLNVYSLRVPLSGYINTNKCSLFYSKTNMSFPAFINILFILTRRLWSKAFIHFSYYLLLSRKMCLLS